MKSISSILVLFTLQCLAALCVSQDFDFFYFVQQWPGSYCDSKKSCCYPVTGKPAADFGIHGLWPNYKDGSYPSNCDPDSTFDSTEIRDLLPTMQTTWPTLACPSGDGTAFWSHEWEKHGTCSESILTQLNYFQSALALKRQTNLLQILTSAGITPNDGFYSLSKIKDAIKNGLGQDVFIECNVDPEGNSQLYQVYTCVDTSGAEVIECPLFPRGRRCGSSIQFPSFLSKPSSKSNNEEL